MLLPLLDGSVAGAQLLDDAALTVISFLIVAGVREIAEALGKPIDGKRAVVLAGVLAAGIVGMYNAALAANALPPQLTSFISLLIAWLGAWVGSAGVHRVIGKLSPPQDEGKR